MLPPRQALDSHQPPVPQGHLWLEIDLQLVLVERPPQVGGEPEPAYRPGLEAGVEQLDVARRRGGGGGRQVGSLEQGRGVASMVRMNGHAGRGVDVERQAAKDHLVADLLPQMRCQVKCRLGVLGTQLTNAEIRTKHPDAQWFPDAGLGLFIHWGIYSTAARHEWVKQRERITDSAYQPYFDHFDPDLYESPPQEAPDTDTGTVGTPP